jgi:RNA polymerase sigma-70 factor (ECF subfamily)
MSQDLPPDDQEVGPPSDSEEVATQAFQRYAGRLIALARAHLGNQVRPKVDPEDVIQSVFRSFFHRHAGGEFTIPNWNSLWGLLVRITLRKCGHKIGHFRAARRDVRREVRAATSDSSANAAPDALSGEPSPAEVAMLAETAEQVMRQLATPLKRHIFELSLQGYSVPEISDRVGHYERGVARVRAEIKARLKAQVPPAASDDP